jgi:hypothetical protein
MANIRKIVKKIIPYQLFRKIEPAGHLVEAVIQNFRYGFPAKGMHIIGVTGTNGKTTTTFLIQKMLYEAGYKVAMLSTAAYGVGNDIKPQIEHMTTAQAGILLSRLRDFKRQGVEWVILETSSHSLAQHRTWGIPYEIAVMTNVTIDHLDYHGTFKNYLEAKRRLFKIAAKHGRQFGVANADDPNGEKFAKTTPRSVTYGIEAGELRAENIKLAADHSEYKAKIGSEEYNIRINIPGKFNISNSLAVVAVGRELGLSKRQIEEGIAALEEVEGRMNVIDEGQPFLDEGGNPQKDICLSFISLLLISSIFFFSLFISSSAICLKFVYLFPSNISLDGMSRIIRVNLTYFGVLGSIFTNRVNNCSLVYGLYFLFLKCWARGVFGIIEVGYIFNSSGEYFFVNNLE